MNIDLEERLRQRMEQATAEIQVPRGLALRAARHRQRRFAIRAGAAAATAAAVAAAGIVVAAQPSAPVVLTAKLLADRASAAALDQPAVSHGQWVYRVIQSELPFTPRDGSRVRTQAGWETADGMVTYGDNVSAGVDTGDYIPAYSELGSLPADPAALDAYLAHLVYPDSTATKVQQGLAAFSVIDDMLMNYVLPPGLEAEVYQALAAIPEVTVDSHVTAVDGRAGVAFVMPETPQSDKAEIILDASDYSFLARADWGPDGSLSESAVAQMVIVGAPGSTQPSLTPPTAAELLAEQADRAVTYTNTPGPFAQPSTWILRELATSSGSQPVWATADDSEQASYVNGTLQVCSRSAACAASTQWLMPAGPSYTLVYPPIPQGRPPFKNLPPGLPDTLPQLLAALNAYATGCADVAGDCNAVNAMANMLAGYTGRGGPDGTWFLMLAEVPGVTVQQVTDVTGQADVALRFPFTDGITEILFNASTHEFAGYVRDGAETVITKQVTVSAPGSLTPIVIKPKPGRLPQPGR
jgi:hypothetical protein